MVDKAQRTTITRIVGPAGAGEEGRAQSFLGSAKTAEAPASKPPMSALPPTALETQQMTQAPAAPVSEGPVAPVSQAQAAPSQE